MFLPGWAEVVGSPSCYLGPTGNVWHGSQFSYQTGSGSVAVNLDLSSSYCLTWLTFHSGLTAGTYFDTSTQYSIDGGSSWTQASSSQQAGGIFLAYSGTADGDNNYGVAMTSLPVVISGPSETLLVRLDSPHSSGGTTSISTDGQFRIASFFDVFTELSIDGGQSWIPQDGGANRMTLMSAEEAATPEPGTMTMVGVGLAAVAWGSQKRKKA